MFVSLAKPSTNTGEAAGDQFVSIEGINGSQQNDVLVGDGRSNWLNGNAGDDILNGGWGGNGGYLGDTLEGGAGFDMVDYSGSTTGLVVNLDNTGYNTGEAAGDQFVTVEGIIGSQYNDVLTGTYGENQLLGMKGDDILRGGAGSDTLDGGAGFDVADYSSSLWFGVFATLAAPNANSGAAWGDVYVSIEGLSGTRFEDTLVGDHKVNLLAGGDGDDVLNGREGADTLDGGAGFDLADYFNAGSGVTVSLYSPQFNTGEAEGDQFISVEGISGSQHGDVLTGDLADNRLNGGLGNDTLEGLAGSDTLDGGSGFDFVSYHFASEFGGGVHASLISGQSAGDTFISIEGLIGSQAADTLIGDHEANSLMGGNGNDVLDGLFGNDTIWGGAGNDWFVFNAALDESGNVDAIMDFSSGEDSIYLYRTFFPELSESDLLEANAFTVGAAASAEQHRIVYDATTGDVYYDADGSGAAAQVKFANVGVGRALHAYDFHIIG